jgi:hypothetical protein
MTMKRPDSPAILGLLTLAAILSIGALVLIGMDRTVPPEVWALIAGAVGAVGGWVGKTVTTETPTPAAPTEAPAPAEPEAVSAPAHWSPVAFVDPVPVAVDDDELARRQNNDVA